jgi:Protein of unknown function (DUF1579)
MSDARPKRERPAPSPQHALLKPFEGTFRATVKLWMFPGEPIVQQGTMVNTFQLGGRFLFQDYTGDPSPPPFPTFLGKGYWGYNTATKIYEGFWVDNASTMMQFEKGDVDESGKIWTMTSSFVHPNTGQTMTKRSVIRLIDDDHNDLTSYTAGPDGKESRNMEITFVRA